ncbi:penicillin-binding transpeptidase domain-containing protein [Enterococcus asini]|uniref:penicillin-binding transpeptidase domain-containing protein n=1 Tax=Enterococcus asini TaxID=57732 RepID=UPI00289178BE|nr:penicillin-binding transpeptidase domain-containing protein [Enterococcus asini]MDT2743880.1 penicillin-binding transpeptidase domain-containing protein [Enterococcus asini]
MRFNRIRNYFRKKNSTPKGNRKKVGILLFATSFGLLFLFAIRLGYIVFGGQIGEESLKEWTDDLYQGSKVVQAKRGMIYDRNGVVIAEDATSYSIFIVLSDTYVSGKKKLYAQEKDFETIGEVFASELGSKKENVVKVLENGVKNKAFQVEFSSETKNLTLEAKQNLEQIFEKKGLAGLYFNEHPNRIYPNGVFSSHFIGYTDTDTKDGSESLVGKMGLEAAYDDILKGTDGKIVYQQDNFQNPLPGTVAEETPAKDGQDIYTTLDSRLQSYLETLMDATFEEYKPEDMTAMLVEAKTGEILSMAQRPTFNPETKEGLDDSSTWMNLLVEDHYEPGSTMKLMTTAAAIDEGIFDENETFVSGSIKIGDTTIRDHDLGEKGILTMRQALSWSSNVGMVTLQQRMKKVWPQYLQHFGFGQSTYSGLYGENAGSLPTDNSVDQAMSSFGQAVNVTNFQMMRAFTAIANDGKMLQPQYISKIVNTETNKEKVFQSEVVGNPVSASAAQKVREYMVDVTQSPNYGSAYGVYSVDDYNISAKTGTAQIYDESTGTYSSSGTDYLYSIVEMIPAEEPEYILYMTIKKPEEWSQKALGNIGNPLLKRAMDLKETEAATPDDKEEEQITVADYRELEVDTAAADAARSGLMPVVIGTGDKVAEQSTTHGTQLLPSEKLLLKTDGDQFYMPDVTGWSKADLMKLGKLFNVEVKFEGEGYCVSQSLKPYEALSDTPLTFTLE